MKIFHLTTASKMIGLFFVFSRLVSSKVYLQVDGKLINLTPFEAKQGLEGATLRDPFSTDLQVAALLSHFYLPQSYHYFNLSSVTADEFAKFPKTFFETCPFEQIQQALRSPHVGGFLDLISELSEPKLAVLIQRLLRSGGSHLLLAPKMSMMKLGEAHSALLSTESGWKVLKLNAAKILSSFDLESLDVVVSHFYRSKSQDVQDMLSTENGRLIVLICIDKFVVKLLDLPTESEWSSEWSSKWSSKWSFEWSSKWSSEWSSKWSETQSYQFLFISELLASVQFTTFERMLICSTIPRPAALEAQQDISNDEFSVQNIDLFLAAAQRAAKSKQDALLALADYLNALGHGLQIKSDVADFILENYNPEHIPTELWEMILPLQAGFGLESLVAARSFSSGQRNREYLVSTRLHGVMSAIDWDLGLICRLKGLSLSKPPLLKLLSHLKCGEDLAPIQPKDVLPASTGYTNIKRFIAQNLRHLPRYVLPVAIVSVKDELADLSTIEDIIRNDSRLYLCIVVCVLNSDHYISSSLDKHLCEIGIGIQASISTEHLQEILMKLSRLSMTGEMLIDLAIKRLAADKSLLNPLMKKLGAEKFLSMLRSKKHLDTLLNLAKDTGAVYRIASFFECQPQKTAMPLFIKSMVLTFVAWPASQNPNMTVDYWWLFIKLTRTQIKDRPFWPRQSLLDPILIEEIQSSSHIHRFDPAPLIASLDQ